MNLVASMANGEFVAIYHSDDVYESTIVEKEVDYLVSHPEAGAVFAMCNFIDEKGAVFGAIDLVPELAELDSIRYEDAYRAMLRHGNMMFVCPTFMVRQRVLHGGRAVRRRALGHRLRSGDVAPAKPSIPGRDPARAAPALSPYGATVDESLEAFEETDPDRSLDVMELYLEQDGWASRLSAGELRELRYQRCDDETTRAANAVIVGDVALARELLDRRFPYSSLLSNVRRRKLRVLALRGVLKVALTFRATTAPLARSCTPSNTASGGSDDERNDLRSGRRDVQVEVLRGSAVTELVPLS